MTNYLSLILSTSIHMLVHDKNLLFAFADDRAFVVYIRLYATFRQVTFIYTLPRIFLFLTTSPLPPPTHYPGNLNPKHPSNPSTLPLPLAELELTPHLPIGA